MFDYCASRGGYGRMPIGREANQVGAAKGIGLAGGEAAAARVGVEDTHVPIEQGR